MNPKIERPGAECVLRLLRERFSDETLTASSTLEQAGVDSLDLIETLFELEQRFDRTLSNAELASLTTIEDLIRVLGSDSNQS